MAYYVLHPGDKVIVYDPEARAFVATAEATPEGVRLEYAARLEAATPAPGPVEKKVYEQISLDIERRAKGKVGIPPGTPPTEAERRPPIPSKLRKKPRE